MAENAQEDFLGREPLSFSLEDASRLLPHAELEKPTSKVAAKFSAAHLGAEVLKHLSHCSSENLLFGEAQIPQPIAISIACYGFKRRISASICIAARLGGRCTGFALSPARSRSTDAATIIVRRP